MPFNVAWSRHSVQYNVSSATSNLGIGVLSIIIFQKPRVAGLVAHSTVMETLVTVSSICNMLKTLFSPAK